MKTQFLSVLAIIALFLSACDCENLQDQINNAISDRDSISSKLAAFEISNNFTIEASETEGATLKFAKNCRCVYQHGAIGRAYEYGFRNQPNDPLFALQNLPSSGQNGIAFPQPTYLTMASDTATGSTNPDQPDILGAGSGIVIYPGGTTCDKTSITYLDLTKYNTSFDALKALYASQITQQGTNSNGRRYFVITSGGYATVVVEINATRVMVTTSCNTTRALQAANVIARVN